jgi:signal peptidase I
MTAAGAAVLHFYEVPSRAMEPTLHQGDRLAELPVVLTGGLHRGSLVAFHVPYDQALDGVSRVVGIPGDHIQVRGGRLIVNYKPVYEPYLRKSVEGRGVDFPSSANSLIDNAEIRRLQSIMYGEMLMDGAVKVPDDYYFVLGDNRGNSVDSRTYGPIPRNAIFARPIVVYSTKAAGSSTRLLFSPGLDVKQ